MKASKPIVNGISNIFLIIFVLFCIFPIFWILLTSLKSHVDINNTATLFRFSPTLGNYKELFGESSFLEYLFNSVIVSFVSTIIVLILGIPASYAIGRFRLGGRQLREWILSMRMFPPIAMVLPLFILFRTIGLLHTKSVLIIIYTLMNLPFAIWLMIGFFSDIPKELDEAGFVDGCTTWQVLFRITLPAAKPGIVATGVLCVIFAWNEFLFSLILGGAASKTVPVAVGEYITDRAIFWGPMAAASAIAIIPILVFSLLVQRHIIRGLTMGAIK